MTIATGKIAPAPGQIAMDKPLFDPQAFRLTDEQAHIATSARRLGQTVFAGGAAAAGGVAFGTEARPTDGGWIVNGKKIFASLSGHADYYGVLCTEIAQGEQASRRNTLYLALPAKSKGVSVVGDWDPLGMRGT